MMLGCLDSIRKMIMPSLYRSESELRRDSCRGFVFFSSLFGKSSTFPVDREGQQFPIAKTFAEWYSYFELLSGSL